MGSRLAKLTGSGAADDGGDPHVGKPVTVNKVVDASTHMVLSRSDRRNHKYGCAGIVCAARRAGASPLVAVWGTEAGTPMKFYDPTNAAGPVHEVKLP